MPTDFNIAVLVSGTGSLLEAFIADGIPIKLVVADRQCRGLEIAEAAGIQPVLLKRSSFKADFDRVSYTEQMIEVLKRHDIDLAPMAGFMTVLDKVMFEPGSYPDRVLNSHPALLPAFIGSAHAVRDALAMGVKVTGTTIHVATAEVDKGRILAQKAVDVLPDDTEDSLHERIKVEERKLYPKAIRDYMAELQTRVE